jgi:hypothetical protein
MKKPIKSNNGSSNQSTGEQMVTNMLKKLGYTVEKMPNGNKLFELKIGAPTDHYISVKVRQSATAKFPQMTALDRNSLIKKAKLENSFPVLIEITLDTMEYYATDLRNNGVFQYRSFKSRTKVEAKPVVKQQEKSLAKPKTKTVRRK